jgi:hypothetical protein
MAIKIYQPKIRPTTEVKERQSTSVVGLIFG